jgi:hypothetical protein
MRCLRCDALTQIHNTQTPSSAAAFNAFLSAKSNTFRRKTRVNYALLLCGESISLFRPRAFQSRDARTFVAFQSTRVSSDARFRVLFLPTTGQFILAVSDAYCMWAHEEYDHYVFFQLFSSAVNVFAYFEKLAKFCWKSNQNIDAVLVHENSLLYAVI